MGRRPPRLWSLLLKSAVHECRTQRVNSPSKKFCGLADPGKQLAARLRRQERNFRKRHIWWKLMSSGPEISALNEHGNYLTQTLTCALFTREL